MTAENKKSIPEFTSKVFFEKRNKYCLLIPLFNEGERFASQTKKMQEANVFDLVDVIICDAGSTDGCSDPKTLEKNGFRALLTRKGKGRYSTDLRMGYAWALEQGYDGFITVDGNDKDGVEALSLFIDKLDEGFDYIQGSRYIEGGEGIRTPWVRQVALKVINEPVMTFAAKTRLTDTTNGFRAYSKKFLLDKNVKPFREVFYGYELIYYLPVRACELDYKVTEVPVRREYPESGEVPSKIGGIRGNMYQMSILWNILRNNYDPK